mmetsp:Transcript_1432/g.4532  ORF Transcript_1432/g.4532 Transcript_1432/m.4532 type:complete len:216 (+) Transcript_1432:1470-2117(+)
MAWTGSAGIAPKLAFPPMADMSWLSGLKPFPANPAGGGAGWGGPRLAVLDCTAAAKALKLKPPTPWASPRPRATGGAGAIIIGGAESSARSLLLILSLVCFLGSDPMLLIFILWIPSLTARPMSDSTNHEPRPLEVIFRWKPREPSFAGSLGTCLVSVSLISDWLPLRAVVDEDLSRCVEADDDDVAFSDRVPSIFSRTSVRLLARPLRAQPAHT